MPIVYVVQEVAGRNILAAREFGKLVTLTSPNLQLQGEVSEGLISELTNRLSTYGDDDVILAMGDPVLIGLVVAIAARVNDGAVTLLKWDRERRSYYPVRFHLTQKEGQDAGFDRDDLGA